LKKCALNDVVTLPLNCGFARLTRYKVGLATQDMLYNGEDERIRIVTTPAVGLADTRIYMYDLDHRIVGEYGGAGVTDIKAEYIWTLPEVGATGPTGGDDGAGGYMPLAIVKGATGDINWVHSHHNAKPILLTNSTGAVVAYGGHAVLGFPGQFANAVGLAGAQYYYNRYRDYNDATGRYIQADPIGLAGDANPYAYAMGNTLRYSDPTGEVAFLIPIVAGAAIGAGTDLAFQAGMNWMQGRQIFNPNCYDWGQVAISGGLGALGGGVAPTLSKWFRYGKGFKIGNMRIAPFGNRNPNWNVPPHKYGRWPHYHRQGPTNPKGGSMPGQGMGRHRPFEPNPADRNWWDRF
jgi:RHS repeat-associated protein